MAKATLIQPPWWNTDDAVTDGAATELIDGVLEPKPGGNYLLRKRPGLQEQVNPGTSVAGQGCHYSEKLDAFFFVSDGKLWKYTEAGVSATLIDTGLHATNTVIFAEGQDLDSSPVIYMADGTGLFYTDGTTLSQPTDPSTPTNCTHVVWFNNRFVANESGTPFFYATGVNPGTGEIDNYYWSGAFNPFVAEQKGDDVTALITLRGELYVAGEEGIETWQTDDSLTLAAVPSAFIEAGLAAPYSMQQIDNSLYALVRLQGELSVAKFEGRNVTPVSQSISRILNDFSTTDDAIAFHVFSGGLSFYVITFPTENQTWAYDVKSNYWAKWGHWDSNAGDYDDYIGRYAAYASKWNTYLVQSQSDSRVYAFSREYLQDGGLTLRTSYTTANFDHGTFSRKRCNSFRLYVKPYSVIGTGDHVVILKWRDDGRSSWSNEVSLDIDLATQQTPYILLKRLGIFRSRQYNIAISDYTDVLIGDAELELTVMRD